MLKSIITNNTSLIKSEFRFPYLATVKNSFLKHSASDYVNFRNVNQELMQKVKYLTQVRIKKEMKGVFFG